MESVMDNSGFANNHKVKFATSSFINKAMTWWNTQVQARGREAAIGMTCKALLAEEFCPSNEMEKLETEFHNHTMVGANHAAYTNRFNELAKLVPHLVTSESKRIGRIEYDQGTCYECGSPDHFRNTCPKLNRAPSQVGNHFTTKVNQNTRNNGNQARGRDFNVNALGALQDPKVVTCTFSLNDHFATICFDSRTDFSFISTKFVPLLNMKSSIVRPGYVIEVADGKKVEVDKIIRRCKLELGNSLVTIDLIPFRYGRIHLESGEVLRVYRECALEISTSLKSMKFDEQKLDDIYVVRDFPEYKEDHEVHLRLVLELLKKESLFAKFSKCDFWLQELHFLRNVVNINGIQVDPSKIEAVKNWKSPKTPSEIRSFLGLAGKANAVADGLSRKEIVKPKKVRAMSMTIQSSIKEKSLAAQDEETKEENALAEMLRGLISKWKRRVVEVYTLWIECMKKDIATYVSKHLTWSKVKAEHQRSPVLWAEVVDDWLIGPEMVQETTDKVMIIKERLKVARDRQKSYADNSSVHDIIHVSNLKKCLADANLCVPLEEIRVDKTLHFVKELEEIMDREVKKLKRSRIPIVKVRLNSNLSLSLLGNMRIL
ncbi:putative reverse transcriptase domain-containing protein [Tanacetum coccineum]